MSLGFSRGCGIRGGSNSDSRSNRGDSCAMYRSLRLRLSLIERCIALCIVLACRGGRWNGIGHRAADRWLRERERKNLKGDGGSEAAEERMEEYSGDDRCDCAIHMKNKMIVDQ